ncbi:zinc-ribbon domain-containing protein [Macrococcoides canis]|uniref:zinc-ribbon domain-containing protein n=1 Tax=Macrococcoides canis TaxID=1855823 RepID=UPI00105FDAA2|nr:zinc-ribbon domain-containing protein [Macrococcus canis]TDM44036.1 zinc-ribbon domain-containing protein [Macrococcus canis]
MKFCPECGNKLIPGAKFCPECGQKIVNSAANEINEDIVNTEIQNANNVEQISEVRIVANRKYNSEEYITSVLSQPHVDGFELIPNIEERKIVNAALTIADNVNPTTIIALYDKSLLSNGKSGIVFVGKGIYLKTQFENRLYLPFKDLKSATLNSRIIEEDEKIERINEVIVNYNNGEIIRFNSKKYGNDFPYKLLADILNEFNNYVDKISSRAQVIQLQQMDNHIIELYFRIVISYLKDDDGIIDSREYKELVSLMTKVKVKKEVAENLRKYRFENIETLTLDELITELNNELDIANISEEAVKQSLAMDIIGTHYDDIDEVEHNEVLGRMLKRLDIDKEKLNFIVRKIKADHEILENKLDDNQIKDIGRELAAVASGAGVSLGALAVTGAVTGWGASLSGGMIALSFGTGGGLLGIAALATAGVGVYKGIKYFSGTNQLEKYGIRMKVLNDHITALRIANSYIIEDINWLSQKTVDFANKLQESNELSTELMKELEYIIVQNKSMADAGTLIFDEQNQSEYEMLMTSIPSTLNIGKYNELLTKNINKIHYDEVIMSAYRLEGDVDEQSELDQVPLRDDITLENLKDVHLILDEIGYFNTKSAGIAQSKAIAKKGFSSLKKSFFETKDNE